MSAHGGSETTTASVRKQCTPVTDRDLAHAAVTGSDGASVVLWWSPADNSVAVEVVCPLASDPSFAGARSPER